jgi:cobalt-zinc-cadmium efflux system outer membrane protein
MLSTLFVLCAAAAVQTEPAAPREPGAPELPPVLTLGKALEIFRARGFDLIVAEANVRWASGDLSIASGLPNPSLFLSAGKNFKCAASQDCSVISYSGSLFDNNFAHRTLEFQLKQNYFQLLLAAAQLEVAKETYQSNQRTRQLNEKKFELGGMNEADLATIQVAALESEQALDMAGQSLRAAKVAVAFLLGFRTLVPDYQVDPKELDYAVPGKLATATRESLLDDALNHRPDLAAFDQQIQRAGTGLRLARRNLFPDIGLGVSYSANGSGDTNISPPNGSINLSFTPPLFYFQSGEIRKAEADLVTQQTLRQKAQAQAVSDVETAWGQLLATRKLVERMERSLLERAQKARDLIKFQYEHGAASLLDLLNAQRTYTATRGEYAQDLAGYWTALSQLELATAEDLR